jgi:serine phosphatase RsbU (regulator of sigma subunit)
MAEVAGDFYDFLQVDNRHVGILIADVSGHGVPAALVASMVKVGIAAQNEHANDPARVLAGLNSILLGKLQAQFVTAAYLYLDLDAGIGRYSAAGHPPLMHYTSADQMVHDVVENGLILGIMPVATYETRILSIAKGDRFLLYTDGVVEAARDGEEFGAERVKRILAQPVPADQLCGLLDREVSSWTRGVASDDITIVAVEVA